MQVFITEKHPTPKALCQLYGFLQVEFIVAQILMVNVIAVNMFVLIYYDKRMYLGKYDWRLLLWMFGYPFVANIVAVCTDTLGPNGTL